MKAVLYTRYGGPEVLQVREIEKPVPGDTEILVKNFATTVTAGDWRMRSANPFLVRIANGLFKPVKSKILGFELAGEVEAVGNAVTRFKKGDHVMAFAGFNFGAYAQYCVVPENGNVNAGFVVHKPVTMSFEEAAAVPVGAMTALAFLRDKIGLRSGQKILIYGASGSVGTFAVQIAKALGAEVTAVCSTSNLEMLQSLGADKIVDYTQTEIETVSDIFDVIFDAVGKTSKSKIGALLKKGGRFKSVMSQVKVSLQTLIDLKDMIEAGKLRTVIDRRYSFEQIPEAHRYVESFRKKGNVVVHIPHP